MRGSIGVHVTHCCKWHGCKYGDSNCPVVSGAVEQEYLCEDCYEDLKEEDYYKQIVARIEEIKKWQENRK